MVIGHVDDQLRALVHVPVGAYRDGPRQEVVAWVDTAFNGGLTIPRQLVAGLGLPQESCVEAVLADSRTVALETFGCFFDWIGGTYQTQVVATDAAYTAATILSRSASASAAPAIDMPTDDPSGDGCEPSNELPVGRRTAPARMWCRIGCCSGTL